MHKQGSKPAWFDRFASHSARTVSRAPFFAFCVGLIVVWLPSIIFLPLDTWQLIINTVTTIITFLMVALLQNAQSRNDEATQDKLNALADALALFMAHIAENDDSKELAKATRELRQAVGLETRESA